jgi:Rrf2 family protein
MLRVSSKGRYGVKAVYELAVHYGEGPMALGVIARAQSISEPYLEQLMAPLKRAGIVDGVRGSQGGYQLARDPATISVGDVVRAVEGPIALADCTGEDPSHCPDWASCVGPDIWNQVQAALVETMNGISLAQLLVSPAGDSVMVKTTPISRREGIG